MARCAADRRPREAELIIDLVHALAVRIGQGERLAVTAEAAFPGAQRGRAAVLRGERRRILGDDEIAVGREDGVGREGELHAAAEMPTGEVESVGAAVVEFDELDAFLSRFRRMVDLVDDHRPVGEQGESTEPRQHGVHVGSHGWANHAEGPTVGKDGKRRRVPSMGSTRAWSS